MPFPRRPTASNDNHCSAADSKYPHATHLYVVMGSFTLKYNRLKNPDGLGPSTQNKQFIGLSEKRPARKDTPTEMARS